VGDFTGSECDKLLRTEIIESQKTQADFLKWKLISVAAVASISLGFGPQNTAVIEAKLLLCLVPLICAYVDLTSLHIMIRIITIGLYLQRSGDPYEDFVFAVRNSSATNPFIFEAVALHGSSIGFNVVLIVLGFKLPSGPGNWPTQYYIAGGALGVVATLIFWLVYTTRLKDIAHVADTTFRLGGRNGAAKSQ
jgi:hypothetical protein